jgi:hypothetical protein
VTNAEGAYGGCHPGTTTVIDPLSGTVIDTLAVGGCAVAVSDNGDHVYVASNTPGKTCASKVSIVDLPAHRITDVPIQGAPNALAVSGNRLYVTDTWHSSLIQITARGSLGVDTDAANRPPVLTVTELAPHLFRVSAVDPDDDVVTVTVTQPFCGTVTELDAGVYQYTPNVRAVDGFVDHFAVTADDGHGGVVTETIALAV